MVYDNEFETMMGRFDNNDAVTVYIWEHLRNQNDSEHNIDITAANIPTLHQTWMPPEDQDTKQ